MVLLLILSYTCNIIRMSCLDNNFIILFTEYTSEIIEISFNLTNDLEFKF